MEIQGKWISGNYVHSSSKKITYPGDYFRKTITIENNVIQAKIRITALGIYVVKINGKQIHRSVLNPGVTCYQHRVTGNEFDILAYLRNGKNDVEVLLTGGFYTGRTGALNLKKVYGYEPKFICEIDLQYEDGSSDSIVSDRSWSWSNDGPLLFSDLAEGEDYDANRIPSYSMTAKECKDPEIKISESLQEITEVDTYEGRLIKEGEEGSIVDFKQNTAGYISFYCDAPKGSKYVIYLGEKLEQGRFTQTNISSKKGYEKARFQKIIFISNGKKEFYKTCSGYFGFRYALIKGDMRYLSEIKSHSISSLKEKTFDFSCSDRLLEKIVENTRQSMLSNFVDIPTDCPTREKAGWTGDAQLFFNTGSFMYDVRNMYRKWLRDCTDIQKDNGMVFNIAPAGKAAPEWFQWVSMEGSSGWGDALITIPYYYYLRYGDDSLIRENYDAMKKVLQFYTRKLGRKNLISIFHAPGTKKDQKYLSMCGRDFGEWTEPKDCDPGIWSLVVPNYECATACIARDLDVMSKCAKLVGKDKEAEEYLDLFEKVKTSYSNTFVKRDLNNISRMCLLIRPLAYQLVDEDDEERVFNQVLELNRKRNYSIGTGFLSTKDFLTILTEKGYVEEVLKVVRNTESGWAKQISDGATTIWENWSDNASLNHYSKGSICEWIFSSLCGIKTDGQKNHFIVEPHFAKSIDEISFSYKSVYGEIQSAWVKEEETFVYNVTVPENCTVELRLNNADPILLTKGQYTYRV